MEEPGSGLRVSIISGGRGSFTALCRQVDSRENNILNEVQTPGALETHHKRISIAPIRMRRSELLIDGLG